MTKNIFKKFFITTTLLVAIYLNTSSSIFAAQDATTSPSPTEESNTATSPNPTEGSNNVTTPNPAEGNTIGTKIEFEDAYLKEILLKLFKKDTSLTSLTQKESSYKIKLSDPNYVMNADQDFITTKEAEMVTELNISNKHVFNSQTKKFDRLFKNITSIKGLEHFVNVTDLKLMFNEVSDITPIQNLTKLTWLNISNNKISNIDVISNFHLLKNLTIDSNLVKDLTPVKDLKNLQYLNFTNNLISDLTPIKNTPVTQFITVYGNSIQDLSPIKDHQAKKEAYSEYIRLKPETNTFELNLKDVKGGEDYYLSTEALEKISAVRVPNTKKYRFTKKPTQNLNKEFIRTEILGDLFKSDPTMKNLWLVWINTENVKVPTANEEVVELNGQIDLTDNIDNLFDVQKVEQISSPIDTSKAGNYEATVKITYNYGDSEEIKVPVKVLPAKVEPEPAPQPEPNPAPTKMKLTFNPGDGVWSDGTNSEKYIFAEKGDEITIPEKPIKEGYKFLYWKGSKYQPGDKYTVVGNHTFVAEWEKIEVSNSEKSLADKYEAKPKDLTVEAGNKINPEDVISNLKDLPKGTKVSFKTPIDTNKLGHHEVLVEVEYTDGSKDLVKVNITVKEKNINTPNNGTNNISSNSNKVNPKTGDTGIMIFMPFVAISGIALFLVSKKKINN